MTKYDFISELCSSRDTYLAECDRLRKSEGTGSTRALTYFNWAVGLNEAIRLAQKLDDQEVSA